LRAITDLKALGEIQIRVDCDVIQADGGTRTASITGGFVALHLACQNLIKKDLITEIPLVGNMAAVSCGIYKDTSILDLDYSEDSVALADSNFVLSEKGEIIEIQVTAEDRAFSETRFFEMMQLAKKGVSELVALQKSALGIE
jgi:ribonuclease PH